MQKRAAFLLLVFTACASGYVPRTSPRIARSGAGYHRDGRLYSAGMLHGGLIDLTLDVPAARELAEGARLRRLAGYVALVGAAGGLGAAEGLEDGFESLICFSLSAALGFGAVVLLGEAAALEDDAINRYNDSVPTVP
jgi:hypothetical protein